MAKFLDQRDASLMLHHTVVEFNKRLIYVIAVHNQKMNCVDVETGENFLEDADFDKIRNPNKGRLGYINSRNGTSYMVRSASRITRMGLCFENMRSILSLHSEQRRTVSHFDTSLFPSLFKTYENIYPSYEEAFEMAVDKGIPTAFDRSFAIDYRGHLYYRNKLIGTANPRGEEFSDLTDAGRELLKVRFIPKLKWR